MLCCLSRRRIDGSLDVDTAVQLLVQSHEHESQYGGRADGDEGRRAVHRHGDHIARSRRVGVHVTRVDGARVAHGVDKGQACRPLGRWPGQCVADPRERDHVARIHARHHEHHAEVARRQPRSRRGDDVGRHVDDQRPDDVPVPLARLVGVPGVGKGRDDAEHVGRRGE